LLQINYIEFINKLYFYYIITINKSHFTAFIYTFTTYMFYTFFTSTIY
jgi:hypothetical protein